MKLGRLGVWYATDKLDGGQIAGLVRAVEGNGYSALWYPESRGYESMSLAGYLLSQSERLVIGSSIYSFSTMLVTFLVGLALGGFVYARFFGEREARLSTFGLVELWVGLSALARLVASSGAHRSVARALAANAPSARLRAFASIDDPGRSRRRGGVAELCPHRCDSTSCSASL